jgi:hypothetical protein
MPRRVANLVLICLFLAGLSGYGTVSVWNSVADRIKLAAASKLLWKSVPTWAEAYFTDHLAARTALVTWHGRIKADWLRSSPTPKVWIGREGWLYFNIQAEVAAVTQNEPPVTTSLVDRWTDALSARQAWLAKRGIRYLVVAAPEKQSVYPEYLPRLARRHGATPLDDLFACCRRDPNLNLVDLRPPLRAARPSDSLYKHTDTHWASPGVYIGYAATVTALSRWYPAMAPSPPTEFSTRPVQIDGGDLARLMGLAARRSETIQQLERVAPARARQVDELRDYKSDLLLAHVRPRVWVNEAPGLPRVLLLGDSFTDEEFCSYLAENCSRLVKVGSYGCQEALIERERPDVVVFEFVERMLEAFALRAPQ